MHCISELAYLNRSNDSLNWSIWSRVKKLRCLCFFSNETNGNAVRMIDVKIRKNELYYIFKEHAILGPTYLNDIKEMFYDYNKEGRLHVGENR